MKGIKEIEKYQFGWMSGEETLLFNARLILDSRLREKLFWQKKAYEAIQSYGRSQLKAELEIIHQKLLSSTEHKSFKLSIQRIFKKR